jgi:hypothetical protein
LLGVVHALHALADGRTRPQSAGTGRKSGLIDVDQRPLFLFDLVAAFEKVLPSWAMLGLEGLCVQQRFFYD